MAVIDLNLYLERRAAAVKALADFRDAGGSAENVIDALELLELTPKPGQGETIEMQGSSA